MQGWFINFPLAAVACLNNFLKATQNFNLLNSGQKIRSRHFVGGILITIAVFGQRGPPPEYLFVIQTAPAR